MTFITDYRQSFLGYADWVNGSHVDDLYSLFGEPFLASIREVLISVATFLVIIFFHNNILLNKTFLWLSDYPQEEFL